VAAFIYFSCSGVDLVGIPGGWRADSEGLVGDDGRVQEEITPITRGGIWKEK